MKIVVCLDDNRGIMFNGRRQSRDRIMRKTLAAYIGREKLWMNNYSAKLFAEDFDDVSSNPVISVSENFLEEAGEFDYCFIEGPCPDESSVTGIIIFWWNRRYPGDVFFDIDLKKYNLIYAQEFKGSSHENIRMEVYIK